MSSLFDKFKRDNFWVPFLKASEVATKNGGDEGSISILVGNPYISGNYEKMCLFTVEIVISEQWSWKVSWFLKEHYLAWSCAIIFYCAFPKIFAAHPRKNFDWRRVRTLVFTTSIIHTSQWICFSLHDNITYIHAHYNLVVGQGLIL